MHKSIPDVKLGMIAVSRDCFVISISRDRRVRIGEEARKIGLDIYEAPTVVESEKDALKALDEVKAAGCNALVVFLGNFGPETPETLIAKYFDGPVMYCAAAEERGDNLVGGRGDAYCGVLNCSYNLGLRKLAAYIPEYPVGDAEDCAKMISEFIPVARTIIGLKGLKLITFGPRPQDFFACNAPIKALYDIGVEIEENSELDLLVAYKQHADDKRIDEVVKDMASELGVKGNTYPELLPRMAQFELTLLDWAEAHLGARKYVAFANKCWPAFPESFGFEPCYVNSRLASRGIPVACEVDIYGGLSEYIGTCITGAPVTLLDINNTVPKDMYESEIKGKFAKDYKLTDTFMGFHCGNTPFKCLSCGAINYQIIQHRLLEDGEPDFTRGTLEGDIAAGEITFFRLHSNADTALQAYVCEGEVLPVATRSFGGIGVFAIPEMGRFYRHVLIAKRYPHHGAVAFGHIGRSLYAVLQYIGVKDISYNRPAGTLYSDECPF
ncbi:MAG: L-fucose/L-arabinose isomerase family protein [Spirochaetales bacterium]|nr:L-fucose/L-arabinose isomerase family protein [Spirochaetales bacterium]